MVIVYSSYGLPCCIADGDWKLIVITQASLVGTLPLGRNVYCIDRIGILPLSVNFDLNTDLIGFEVGLKKKYHRFLFVWVPVLSLYH